MTKIANIEAANELAHQFRVYHTNEQTMEAMRAARDSEGIKNAEFVSLAIAKHLGQLQDQLLALGFGKTAGRKAIRLPMLGEQLEQLKQASEKVGVPASDLLLICLAQASQGHFPEAPKATKKPNLHQKPTKARKAKGSQEKAAPEAKKARKPRAAKK